MIATLLLTNFNTKLKQANAFKVLCLLLLNILAVFSAQGQTQAVIPTGNTGSNPQPISLIRTFPFGNSFPSQKSIAIYTGSEVAAAAGVTVGTTITITHISYYLESVNTPAPTNVTIRLEETSNLSFPSSQTTSTTFQAEAVGSTVVFTGPVTVPTPPNWVTVDIADFTYNTSSNLEVFVESNCITCANAGSGIGDEFPLDAKQFRYHTTGLEQFIFFTHNAPTSTDPGETTTFRPNIQLTVTTGATQVCEAPTNVSVTGGTNSITVSFTPSGGLTGNYFINYGGTIVQLNNTGASQTINNVPANTYNYSVYKECGTTQAVGGTGTVTVTDPAPLTCDPPSNLSATNVTQTSASLNFTPSSTGATGTYTVEYGPSGFTPGTGTILTGVTSSPVNISGLTAGTAYQFYVTKNCSGSNSTRVGPANFTTQATPTCAAPTTVNGTPTGQNSAQITFSGGDAGTSYIIEYGPTSTFPSGTTTITVSGSPANLTGLTANTSYTFVVRTNCSNGVTSSNSPQGTFTTNAIPQTCAAPTTVNGTGTGQNTAQVTFSGGDAGTSYVIEYGPSSTFPSGTTTATVSGSPATLTGLTANTSYTFVVRTNCSNGVTSANSPSGTFTTNSVPQTCAAPTTVNGSGTGQNTAQVTFSGGDAGTSYIIQYGPSATYPTGSTTANVAGSPANLSNLTAGTQYTFVVRTNCANGLTSADSPQGTFTTSAAPVACDAPTSVSGSGTGQTTAQITFSGGTATGAYIIEYGPTSTFPNGTSTANVSGSPANLTNLTPGTAYTFVVRTNCGNGNISNNSPQGTFTTTAAPQTCAAPTTVNGTGTGQNTAQVTFSGGDAGTSYVIEYGPTSTFPSGTTTATVSGSPATLTGLTANTSYTFVVRTNCSNGVTSSNSPQGTFTTSATPPVCVIGTWLGTTSSDWHTAANWCNGIIPDGTTNVLIPQNTSANPVPNYPVITANAFANNLTIEVNATLTLSSGLLTINGLFTNLGTLIDNGDGSLAFTGPTPQTLGKPGNVVTFLDLTIGPGGAVQAGTVRVRRVLTLNGNLTTLGNELTLLADNAVQSMVVNNGTAQVIGAATMEKYINPGINPSFGYRHLTSPVANATISQLNDDLTTPLVVNPAYNTNPTPATTVPFPTIYRYNESRLDLPIFTTPNFDSGWESPNDLNEVMPPAVGYTVNMMPVEIDFTGTLNNGSYTRTLTRGNQPRSGYNFLGNPYPSPLNWDLVNLPAGAVDRAAYVVRSTGQYTGTYVAYVNGIPANGEYIAAMQGFFVRATVPSTSITFENDDRVTTYENPALYRKVETRPVITLALRNATGIEDKTYVYFENGATANFDGYYDAFKLPNTGPVPSIFSRAGNDQLAINGLPVSTGTTIVPLGGRVPLVGTWTITADQIVNFLPNQTIYLEDIATNTLHNLSQQNSFTFSTTQTDLNGRFFLRFGPGAVTGVTPAELAAKVQIYPNPNNGQFTISMPALNTPVVEATLYNAIGQQVWQKALPTNGVYLKETITTNKLVPGVYTLRIETSAGPVQRKIIIE